MSWKDNFVVAISIIAGVAGVVAVNLDEPEKNEVVKNPHQMMQLAMKDMKEFEIPSESFARSPMLKKLEEQVTPTPKRIGQLSKYEFDCLARNIFFEAGVDSHRGKLAVATVVARRLEIGKWGKDICSVVHAKAQFSWTLSKKLREFKPHGPLWEESLKAAKEFADGKIVEELKHADHYYAEWMPKPPGWAKKMKFIGKAGSHLFFVSHLSKNAYEKSN